MRELEDRIKEMKNNKEALKDKASFEEFVSLTRELEELKKKANSELTPWQRVQICRHPERPQTSDYIKYLTDEFEELHGDRLYGDDSAIIGGLGYIDGKKFVIIGQEKGKDTETRLRHNFGMPYPEGYRKALRLMAFAEKFKLPVVTFIDTPGAYPGLAAEERGQGWAIAKNLFCMSRLKTPIICLLIGEGCSGGALGIGIGDQIGMLEHSYYSVISPEGCASILWKDAKMSEHAASILKMHPEQLLEMSIIDKILPEPIGGAHKAPDEVYKSVKDYILDAFDRLAEEPIDQLLEKRYEKFRSLGVVLNQEPFESVESFLLDEIE